MVGSVARTRNQKIVLRCNVHISDSRNRMGANVGFRSQFVGNGLHHLRATTWVMGSTIRELVCDRVPCAGRASSLLLVMVVRFLPLIDPSRRSPCRSA